MAIEQKKMYEKNESEILELKLYGVTNKTSGDWIKERKKRTAARVNHAIASSSGDSVILSGESPPPSSSKPLDGTSKRVPICNEIKQVQCNTTPGSFSPTTFRRPPPHPRDVSSSGLVPAVASSPAPNDDFLRKSRELYKLDPQCLQYVRAVRPHEPQTSSSTVV